MSYALILTLTLTVPGIALAKDKGGEKKPGWKVTAVDTTANTITVHSGKKRETGEDKTYKAADATVTVDGKSAKLADVSVGMGVKITAGATPDAALSIAAMAKKEGGKKGGKKGKNKDGEGSSEQ